MHRGIKKFTKGVNKFMEVCNNSRRVSKTSWTYEITHDRG